jgi:MFS family permease
MVEFFIIYVFGVVIAWFYIAVFNHRMCWERDKWQWWWSLISFVFLVGIGIGFIISSIVRLAWKSKYLRHIMGIIKRPESIFEKR